MCLQGKERESDKASSRCFSFDKGLADCTEKSTPRRDLKNLKKLLTSQKVNAIMYLQDKERGANL